MENKGKTTPKWKKTTISISIMAWCMICTAMPAFADVDIAKEVTVGLNQVYKIISAVVLPIAIIALAVCAAKMIGGDTRAGENAKNAAIKIVVGLAIVYLAPVIIQTVSGWFSKGGTTINGVTFGN